MHSFTSRPTTLAHTHIPAHTYSNRHCLACRHAVVYIYSLLSFPVIFIDGHILFKRPHLIYRVTQPRIFHTLTLVAPNDRVLSPNITAGYEWLHTRSGASKQMIMLSKCSVKFANAGRLSRRLIVAS